MANKKSAQKRILTNEIRRQRNVARKTDVKTSIKKVLAAIDEKNLKTAEELLKATEGKIARTAQKGVFKKETAARKVSRLAKRVAALKRGQ